MRAILLSLSLLLPALAATADEVSVALGAVGLDLGVGVGSDEEPALAVEYRPDPFFARGRTTLGLAMAVEFDDDRDLFAGIGLALMHGLGEDWRVGLSVLPGAYAESDGKDLGGTILFRTELEVARRVGARSWLGLALGHKSNAGLYDRNPGEDSWMIKYSRRF
jgi:hypothetical protein